MIKILCALAFVACVNAFSHKNCDRSSPVSVNLRSVPDPIRLSAGSSIPIKASLNVKSQVPSRVKVHVKIYKKVWFYVKMPCVSNFGSCTYDVDCGALSGLCAGCSCPFPIGQLDIDETVKVPSISIPSFLVNGKYKVKYEVKSLAGARLACGEAIVNLSK